MKASLCPEGIEASRKEAPHSKTAVHKTSALARNPAAAETGWKRPDKEKGF